MQIRDAEPQDHDAIVAIYNAAIPGRLATADLEAVTVASKRQWFADHVPGRRPLWVLEEECRINAWLSFQSFYGRPAYDGTVELSIYVAAERQRRGHGRALLERALGFSPTVGIKTLLGFIFGHNEPSLALFRNFGFEQWAHLPRVANLDGIERDLLILGRRLGAP